MTIQLNSSIYCPEQARWRDTMIKYIVATDSFRQDFLDGKITKEMLESWGMDIDMTTDGNISITCKEILK